MDKELIIVAKIQAKPDHIELVKAELNKLIAPTLKEEGCIQYDLHKDNQNPEIFLFYEIWQSRELWQQHMNAAHLAEFNKVTEGAVAGVSLNEMTKL